MATKVCKNRLVVFTLFLIMNNKIQCQFWMPSPPPPPPEPSPLCATQFSLANHACGMLPLKLVPPPPPLSPLPPAYYLPPPSMDSPPSPGSRHRHRHRHRVHKETAVEQECCRWLHDIDSECVCNMLVRLPSFLARPVHQYSVLVDPTCTVNYTCSGRLMSV